MKQRLTKTRFASYFTILFVFLSFSQSSATKETVAFFISMDKPPLSNVDLVVTDDLNNHSVSHTTNAITITFL